MVTNMNQKEFQEFLYTKQAPEIDLLIRTSGEKRLSDFMLWQGSHARIEFLNIFWPEMSIWKLICCLVKYQELHSNEK
jgi:undecaprenyl diphosphate synthase